jgi:phosphonate transport system substrate-binding protein
VSAIFAVLDGRADSGAAKDTFYNDLVSKDPSIEQELEIVARSPKVPEVTLCIKSEIDQDLRENLGNVLVNMNKTPDGIKVLQKFKAIRFVNSRKEDFILIEKMAQRVLGGLTIIGK